MNAAVNHCGPPLHKRLADMRAGIEVLETATRSWRAFTPRAASLDMVIAQADAVTRGLRELRQALSAEQNRTPPAA